MKKVICVALLALFYFPHIYAEVEKTDTQLQTSHFHLGGDFLRLQVNTENWAEKITGKNTIKGLRFGYDFIKPEAFYFGYHFFLAFSDAHYDFQPKPTSWFTKPTTGKGWPPLTNFELRFGKTFAGYETLATLFAGIGNYNLNFLHGENDESIWLPHDKYGKEDEYEYRLKDSFYRTWLHYLTGGAMISYDFGPSLSIGSHLKLFWLYLSLQSFHYKSCQDKDFQYEKGKENSGTNWGVEIALPFTWHVGKILRMQLEPYYLKLNTKGSVKGYGARLLLGFWF